jgi:hypothetical protein
MPPLTGRIVAAWPSFAFVGAYGMLMGQLRATEPRELDPGGTSPVEGGRTALPGIGLLAGDCGAMLGYRRS